MSFNRMIHLEPYLLLNLTPLSTTALAESPDPGHPLVRGQATAEATQGKRQALHRCRQFILRSMVFSHRMNEVLLCLQPER